MNKALEMLTSLIAEEAKRSVFASFSSLRFVTGENKHSYDESVERLRKNEVFVAAKTAGVDMKELKTILIEQYKKQTEQLLERLSQSYDYACDPEFLIIKKKEKE